MPMLQLLHVTLSHFRSKELPGLHFVCSRATCQMWPGYNLAAIIIDVETEIDCGD